MQAPPEAQDTQGAKREQGRRSRRGVAVILFAKVWFLLTGFAQPVLLTTLLGTSEYGLYGTVLNTISIVNNLLVAGSIQSMSRAVTQRGASAIGQGIKLHVALSALTLAVLLALSEPLGTSLLRDPQLPGLLRVAALVAANYCVYAALVGALNGQQSFVSQAGLDITFATLRTGLVLLGARRGGVEGALQGFALASTLITVLAGLLVWRQRATAPASAPAATDTEQQAARNYRETAAAGAAEQGGFVRPYLAFFLPVLGYQLLLNLVFQADLLGLKAALARTAGLELAQINTEVGLYKAVQNFAFLPYQLLLAVTFVAFPVVSRATLEGDREASRRFLSGALRFSVVLLGLLLSVLVGMPRGVLHVAYGTAMDAGAPALRLLSLGQGAFALCVIGTTVLVAAGRTGLAAGLMTVLLALVATGDALSLHNVGSALGEAAQHTALGTAAGCTAGLVLVGVVVHRLFGAFVPLASAVRSALAAAVTTAALFVMPVQGRVGSVAQACVGGAIYVVVLLVLGEVSASERAALLGRVRRR